MVDFSVKEKDETRLVGLFAAGFVEFPSFSDLTESEGFLFLAAGSRFPPRNHIFRLRPGLSIADPIA